MRKYNVPSEIAGEARAVSPSLLMPTGSRFSAWMSRPGNHMVVYRPMSLIIGLGISIAETVALALLVQRTV